MAASSAATLAIKLAGEDAGAEAATKRQAAALDQVKKSADEASGPLRRAGEASEASGKQAEKGGGMFGKLKESLVDVGKVAAGFVLGKAAMSLGAGLGDQLKDMVSGTQEYGEAVRKLAMTTGASTEQASSLLFMFKEQNVEADAASRSLVKFAKGLQGVQDAEDGAVPGGKTTLEVLRDLGVTANDAAGRQRSLVDVLGDVADKFKELPDGQEKTARAMQLFGKSGADMLPVLNLGKEGLEEAEAAAKKYGLALSADNVAQIHKFAMAHKDMDGAIEGVRLKLAVGLMPALTKTIEWLTEGTTHLLDFVGGLQLGEKVGPIFEPVGAAIGKVVDMVKALGSGDANSFFLALTEGIQGIVGGPIDRFHEKITGITNLLFGTLPQALDRVIEPFKQFGDAIGSAFGQLRAGNVLGAMENIVASFYAMRARLLETMAGMGAQLVTAITQWAKDAAPPLVRQLGELASTVLAWAVAQIPPLAAQLARWADTLVSWAADAIPPLLRSLGDLLTGVLDWIGDNAPDLVQTLIGQWVPAFLEWVVPALAQLLVKLGELLIGITTWIITVAVPKIIEVAFKIGEGLVKGVIDAAKELGPKLGQAISDAFASLNLDFGIFHIHGGQLKIDLPMGNALTVGATVATPGHALGGPEIAGMPRLVGEKGPEIFVPGSNGYTFPNSALGAIGGNTTIVHVAGSIWALDELADAVRSNLLQKQNGGGMLGNLWGSA